MRTVLENLRAILEQGTQSSNDITKNIRLKVADFTGSMDPQTFADWLASLEDYFDW